MQIVQNKVTVKVLRWSPSINLYVIKSKQGKVLHIGSLAHIRRMLKRYA